MGLDNSVNEMHSTFKLLYDREFKVLAIFFA